MMEMKEMIKLFRIIALFSLVALLLSQAQVIKIKLAYNELVDEINECRSAQPIPMGNTFDSEQPLFNWSVNYG